MNTPLAALETQWRGDDANVLSVQAASERLQRLVQPITGTETISLLDAPGRVLADDVVCPVSVPPHDNSAMDGYAFDGAQLRPGQPLRLHVAGTALAGKPWQGTVGAGQCLRIMTGALLPAGLDTVVPQELAQFDDLHQIAEKPRTYSAPHSQNNSNTATGADPGTDPGTIVIAAGAVRRGDNRRLAGEDLMAGQPALRRGQRLHPAACGLLASLGQPAVTVMRRLKVACFSTGDEILSPGQPARHGAVFDSNRHALRALLTGLGCEIIDLGVVPDDPAALRAAFSQAAAQADAIVTSGGVSVGEADHTKALMQQLGEVAFWRIAMRPGRPLAVGRIGPCQQQNPAHQTPSAHFKKFEQSAQNPRTDSAPHYQNNSNPEHHPALLFGLPGNPVAALVSFLALVRPALLKLMGAQPEPPLALKARSAQPLHKKPGRTEFQRGIVTPGADGLPEVRTTGAQGSAMLRSMVQANALIVLPHDQAQVPIGDWVEIWPLHGLLT